MSQKRGLQQTIVARSTDDYLPDMEMAAEQLITKVPCNTHAVSHGKLHGYTTYFITSSICPANAAHVLCAWPDATTYQCILCYRHLQTRAPTTVELCQSCKWSTSGSLPVTARNSSAALLKNMNRSMSSGCTQLQQHAVMNLLCKVSTGKVGAKGARTPHSG
jgi:hypothetical protein